MYTFLIVLTVIVSLLLILVVLVQNSKGGGLAANFAAGNQIFGVRQTADTLEKATWYLSITLGLLCIIATAFPPQKGVMSKGSTIQKNIENVQNHVAQPGFDADFIDAAQEQTIEEAGLEAEKQIKEETE